MSAYVVGMDLGSTSAECVVIDERREIVATAVVETGTVSRKGLQRAIDEAFGEAGIERDLVRAVAATGYGRRLVPGGADFVFTEISAHARGVAALFPGVRLVVDIGGQDTKAIQVDEAGRVERFAMNDRCASGTGRFYEGLAHALETDIESLGEFASRGKADLEISSLCATFAVTEVIALLAKGHDPADIAASVHHAAAARTLGLIGQVGKASPVALTGGVARNAAVVHSLSEALGEELLIPENPQITGAYGAALLAAESLDGGSQPDQNATAPAPPHDHGGSGSCADCAGSKTESSVTMLTLTAPSGRVV
ncbi:acyl-CoA dehydratase activase [Prauserella flavalba]|uniref:Benzoyl-CoA reductase n=1 Tax=Prauserella flavalba TaxID=1477506 RepID=A0A318LMZ5_9PSEU|nr:acyl-CoA dehydratase activase [Prauserella flavalba]PXY18414.1 benzoyl-CoA reductase [Prauserella flavalba]